jgi:hypothetical protein
MQLAIGVVATTGPTAAAVGAPPSTVPTIATLAPLVDPGKPVVAHQVSRESVEDKVKDKVNHIEELRTTVAQRLFPAETIEVPQALDVLFQVLQNSQSPDQVSYSFKVIEQSVAVTLSPGGHNELSSAANQAHLRNAEQFFNQKDWLVWLCDLIVLHRRQAMNAEDRDGGASVFSLSESESVGGGYFGGGGNADYDGEESENSSMAGDSLGEDHMGPVHKGAYKSSVGSGESLNGRVSAWQQNLIDQFTGPIFLITRKLLLQDMVVGKVSSSRRWNELFRLSLPELNYIQERLLLDLVSCMENLSEFCEDVNSIVNLLKNLSAVLEQTLEKADMSLMFNVKVVTALHSLSYNCPSDVRARIKETALPEIRKSYVVRVLLDNTQDYYTKVAAISEISASLQGYIASTDSKVLSDTNVIMLVLGMLVEACEDLEFLLGGVDSSSAVLNESAGHYRGGMDDPSFVGSPIPASTFDRVHVLFEVLEVLIEAVQNCAIASSEGKKCVTKLFAAMASDPSGHLLAAMLNTFGMKPKQHRAGSGTAAGDAQAQSLLEGDGGKTASSRLGVTAAAPSSTVAAQPASTYTWWGGWTGGVTGETPSEDPVAPAKTNDVEDGHDDRGALSEAGADEQGLSGPNNIRSFITWFCAADQRYANEHIFSASMIISNASSPILLLTDITHSEVQAEFRLRVLGEIRSTHRVVDKLREKNSQRYMRYTRLAQEKRTKEKLYASKAAKDALAVSKTASDKVAMKFQKDTKTYVSALNDKFEAGKALFHSSLEV